MSRVTILGATGSIGTSTLDVITERPEVFEVEAVTANSNTEGLARAAIAARARLAVIADPARYGALKEALSGTGIEAAAGDAAVEAAAARPVDTVVAAIVGAAGLAPTLAAIRAGSRVALANKECLVCAGDLFMATARQAGVAILPLDSEHNAIFQALGGRPIEEVDRIIVTASGGPFRSWSLEAMAAATPAQALKHPKWAMGPKISIDSATLMNKGLEVIEAHHLFGLPSAQIGVLVHPQSVVHGIVAFRDGAMLAHMGPADMRLPIAHCLAWPKCGPTASARLDLALLHSLTFDEPDMERFPALRLALAALDMGGAATNILNAANEVAVAAFLSGAIGFLEIAGMVADTIERAAGLRLGAAPRTVEEALALDREARQMASERIARRVGGMTAAAG